MTLPTYDPVKAPRVLQEAALAVLGHGFGDQFGDMAETDGWNGLAYVSAVVLDNLGEHDLATEYRSVMPGAAQVWVRTVFTGVTFIRTSAWVGTPEEQKLLRAWDALNG
jgi:hypothetical protein